MNSDSANIDLNNLFLNEPSMFEVYKRISSIYDDSLSNDNQDLELFTKLKAIITPLLAVKPEERMKLIDARKKLDELDQFRHFLLLDSFLQQNDSTMTHTDENTQNSFSLMDEIRNTRLFTIPVAGEEMELTQRSTNLCVPITAMRLLSYALVDFLEPYCRSNSTVWNEIIKKILKYPDVARTSADAPEGYHAPEGFQALKPSSETVLRKKDTVLIQQLILICCGVISPRSLHGLNHCHLDDAYYIEAQVQNIREYKTS